MRNAPSPELRRILPGESEAARYLRQLDWGENPLGPPATWPPHLRASVGICLTSRCPMLLWWGGERTLIYNDACLPLLGAERHPAALGRSGRDAWSKLWGTLGPIVEEVFETGQESALPDLLVGGESDGGSQELASALSFTPVCGEGPAVDGVFCTAFQAPAPAVEEEQTRLASLAARERATTDFLSTASHEFRTALSLMLGPLEQRVQDVAETLPAERPATPLPGGSVESARPRVLFADENSDLRRYVGRLLAPYYEVEAVGDGESALQRILASPPDVILAEAMIPLRDGESLLRQLRADPRTRNLPVIALSSRAADWRIEGAQQRADDYVVKPFTAHELLARVAAVLEFARLRRRVEEQTRRAAAEAARRAAERLDGLEQDLATLRRREEVLAQANASLQARLAQLEAVNAGVRDSRRAALNLLEDAVESRRRQQEEMAERQQAEEAVRESEEQFRRAIEEAPVPIVMLAEDGQMLQVSKSWAELTGYSREETPTLESWLERAYGAGAAEGRARVEEVLRGRRSSEQVELEVVTRSGERRAWMVSASPVGALRDGRRFVVAMALDVTERRQAEQALAASQEQLRLIVESAHEYAIFSLDLERRVTSWNRGAEQMMGYRREEMLGRSADLIFTEEDCAAGAPGREAGQALAEGRAADERWHVRKDGSRFWGSGVMLPMHVGADSQVIGFVKIFRDETEKLRASEALEKSRTELWQALQETEKARAEAEAAGRAKDHFLAVLSHELRTPLTPVLMATHTLARRKDLPDAVREALAMIRRNIEMESGFVDDLLDVTRLSRGKLELIHEPMDVHQAVSHAIEICQGDIEGRGQRLAVELGAGETRIEGDFARVQQVVWNLLKNASKFTPEGGDLRLRTRNQDGVIVVEVTDSGIGIEPEALGRIFDPFIQADQSITRQFGGLGLGLAIARATVEAHGGELRAESPGAGQGATFSFSLPLGAGKHPAADGGQA